jgi:ubiquinone/menaquinone biosynthesis C-methylase UbiE
MIREADLTGRRVLDIGCGTGRFLAQLAPLAKAWGVDASPEMLDVARARSGVAGLKLGTAEQLPFKDGWFERALMWLVVHLVDRPRALGEAFRVLRPDGRFAIGTFHPLHFERYWLKEFFPSLEAIDKARFPSPEELDSELQAAGFDHVERHRLTQTASVARETAIERVRRRFISPLQLLDETELANGIARMESELPEHNEYALEWLVAIAYR